MKHIISLFAMLFSILRVFSQQSYDLEENKPILVNGIEYGYTVVKEEIKKKKDVEYSYFTLKFWATNKNNCDMIVQDEKLVEFFCTNYSKPKGFMADLAGTEREHIKLKEFIVPVTLENKTTIKAKIGYIFRINESINSSAYSSLSFICAKGEKPKIKFTPQYLRTL